MRTRRQFISTFGGSLAATAIPALGRSDQALDLKTISIIHTTDLHGNILPTQTYEGIANVGGLARCATLMRTWRQQNPDNLLIDVGDLYQGTHLSRRNEGALMVKLLNKLNYDAWVLGNHDFDWGIEPAQAAVRNSQMPVLGANLNIDGKPAGSLNGDSHPFANVAPYTIKKVAGFRIGILGLTTPGLPYWLRPEMLEGIQALDPAEATGATIRKMKAEGVDAVVAAGHMGSKWGKDDFANRVHSTLEKNREIDVYIAGHTHKDLPQIKMDHALYAQANYYGIHLGRIDLTFSRSQKKLIHKRAFSIFMDNRFEPDPLVLNTAKDEIAGAEKELAKPLGRITAPLKGAYTKGTPNDLEKFIAAGIRHALAQRKVHVDAVLHGAFHDEDLPGGDKTVKDMWTVIPYENMLVTAQLTPAQITTAIEEIFNSGRFASRNLVGIDVTVEEDNGKWNVKRLSLPKSDAPLDASKRYTIALNSYDAQSGGQRFMKLRDLIKAPESQSAFHPIETRDAMIDFFLSKREISPASL